jgi:two-component system, OmpR family, response regulator
LLKTPFGTTSTARSKRVLVVEDDPSSSNALRLLLSACGYQVVTADTVASAHKAIDDSFDSVILDLMLPDGDGAEVLSKVRADGLKARVYVTTGVSNPEWLERVRTLGAECVLKKPIDMADLLEKLRGSN